MAGRSTRGSQLRTPQRMYEKCINGFDAVNPLKENVFRMNTTPEKPESLV